MLQLITINTYIEMQLEHDITLDYISYGSFHLDNVVAADIYRTYQTLSIYLSFALTMAAVILCKAF